MLIAATLAGCDLFVTPERAFDDVPRAPEVVAFDALSSDLRYAGEVQIAVEPGLATFPIRSAALFVDGDFVDQCAPTPCVLRLDTEAFEDGPHTLTLSLAQTEGPDPSLGLGNVLGLGAAVRRDTLVFDQSPPSPVTIDAATWDAEGVRLQWSSPPGANRNARRYRVLRYDAFGALETDFVMDAPATTFLDSEPSRILGDRKIYVVEVENGAFSASHDPFRATSAPDTAWASTPLTPSCPEDITPEIEWPRGADRGVAFCNVPSIEPPSLISYDVGGASFEATPAALQGSPTLQYDLVSSPGGAFALVSFPSTTSSPTHRVARVDPLTLDVGPFVPLAAPERLIMSSALDGQDRLFVVGQTTGTLFVFDLTTGALLQQIEGDAQPPGTFVPRGLIPLPDDRLVYVGTDLLLNIDTSARPAEVAMRAPYDRPGFSILTADAGGQLYEVVNGSDTVLLRDPTSFARRGGFAVDLDGGTGLTRAWGGLDGIYVYTAGPNGSTGVIVRLTGDGAEVGRRPSRLHEFLFPTSVAGRIVFGEGIGAPFLDSIPE